MAILTTRYERMNMSEKPKKFEKKNLLYLVIAGLALVIIILLASWVIISNNSGATTEETGTTAKVSSSASSSSTGKYVENEDYKIEYSNLGTISKQKLNKKLKEFGIFDYDTLMDVEHQGKPAFAPFSEVQALYNKNLDWLIITGTKVARQNVAASPRENVLSVWSLKDDKQIEYPGSVDGNYETDAFVVYTWTNLDYQ